MSLSFHDLKKMFFNYKWLGNSISHDQNILGFVIRGLLSSHSNQSKTLNTKPHFFPSKFRIHGSLQQRNIDLWVLTDHNNIRTWMIEAGAVQTQFKEEIDIWATHWISRNSKHPDMQICELRSLSLWMNQAALPTCKHPVAIWCSCNQEFVTDSIGHNTVWLVGIGTFAAQDIDSRNNISRVFQHNSLFQRSIIRAKWCKHSNASSFKARSQKIESLSLHTTTQVFYTGQQVDPSLSHYGKRSRPIATIPKQPHRGQRKPTQKNHVYQLIPITSSRQGGEHLFAKGETHRRFTQADNVYKVINKLFVTKSGKIRSFNVAYHGPQMVLW